MRHRICVVFLVAVWLAASASAQTGNGSLRGYIKDQQGGALPGVTVTATSPQLLGPATAASDQTGYYRLVNLPPGTYKIAAELEGFATYVQEGILLRAGSNFQVDVVMQIGTLQETVTVSGESPMLEVSKPSNVLNIDGEFQKQLPVQARRMWSDFIELTPGVVAKPKDDNSGQMVFYAHGGEIAAHVLQIEGMPLVSYSSGQPAYISMGGDTVQDVQVKGGGVDAAEPTGTGLVVNVVSKSGGNDFSGGVGYALQPLSWNGDNPPPATTNIQGGGTPTIQGINQLDASLGGPIRRDKIWFFTSYRYADLENGISRTPEMLALLKGYVSGFTPFNNKSKSQQPFVKITAQLSSRHQLNAYWQHDRMSINSDQAQQYEPYWMSTMGGDLFGGKVSSTWGTHTTTQFTVAYNNKSGASQETYDKYQAKRGQQIDIHQSAYLSQGRLLGTGTLVRGGNVQSVGLTPASMLIFRGDLTYFKEGWGGSHEFQTGIYAAPRLRITRTTKYVNGGFTFEERRLLDPNNIGGATVPFHRRYVTPDSIMSGDARDRDIGIYVQDSWKPVPRLTANLGVRVDFVKRHDAIFNIDRMNSVEVGPRLGFSYLVTGDARNVLRGSIVRVHEQVNGRDTSTSRSAGGGRVETRDMYDLNGDGVFETQFVTPALTAALAGYEFDPTLHQPYIDEYIVGFRKQFRGQFAFDVAGIHRQYKARVAYLDVNGIYPDGPGQPFIGFGKVDPTRGLLYQLTNNTWDRLVYTAIEVTATKNMTHNLQFVGGAARGWQHLSGTWNPIDPARFIQPSAYANNRQIWPARGLYDHNSLAGGLISGYSPSWIKYRVSLAGNWIGPSGILASANFAIQSGPYSGFLLTKLAADDPEVLKYGPATVPVQGGVQPNPLATTTRFKYRNRGEGQVQAPAIKVLNLKVGKKVALGGKRSLELDLNVFNVFNGSHSWQWDFYNATEDWNPKYLTMLGRQAARAAQASFIFRF